MSDFFVKTIVDELAEAGFPLSAQQIDALSTSRKKAVAKAREEIKNAVRASLLANGLNFNEIKIAARAMTQETVNNTLKERKLDSLINQAIENRIRELFPPASDIRKEIKSAIEREAAKRAHDYINENLKVDVTINEAGHYPQGGTF